MTTKPFEKDAKARPLIGTAHFPIHNFNHSSSSIFALSQDDVGEHYFSESPNKILIESHGSTQKEKLSAWDPKNERLEEGDNEISYLSMQESLEFDRDQDNTSFTQETGIMNS